MPYFVVVDRFNTEALKKTDVVRLSFSTWNDYSYRTLFNVEYIHKNGSIHSIGQIKIAFIGQEEGNPTQSEMGSIFEKLDDVFFSLSSSVDFYTNLYALGKSFGDEVLKGLNCVLVDHRAMGIAELEEVFKVSLLRNVHINNLKFQLNRIRDGYFPSTSFYFSFKRESLYCAGLFLNFNVMPDSLPPTNIHTIIGSNGLGKTTILNGMVDSIVSQEDNGFGRFIDYRGNKIEKDFFSSVISIAFSAFDPFRDTNVEENHISGFSYHYIGLKNDKKYEVNNSDYLRNLHLKCSESVYECLSDEFRRELWIGAMSDLESDENFKEFSVLELSKYKSNDVIRACQFKLMSMSSGHSIVFITLSMLIEKIQHKTLVLFDEPESHLHPPLLSTLIRIMSSILHKRNGVAIIATHSPVVVQEVPKSCCWVLNRYDDVIDSYRPSIETFAENVGLITKEVFKLEMENSGYHRLLKKHVDNGFSYDDIIERFDGQLGFEGRAVLLSMVLLRDDKIEKSRK